MFHLIRCFYADVHLKKYNKKAMLSILRLFHLTK